MSLCLRCTCCDCSSSDDWLRSLQAGVSVCCGCRETLGDVWFLCAWRPGVARGPGGSSGRGWFGSPSLKAACRCLSGAFVGSSCEWAARYCALFPSISLRGSGSGSRVAERSLWSLGNNANVPLFCPGAGGRGRGETTMVTIILKPLMYKYTQFAV